MTGLLTDRIDGPRIRSGQAQVTDALGRDIVAGRIAAGDLLPGDEPLAARFGVSRTVLRETFKTLAAKGLVQARPRTGTRVLERRFWNLLDADVLGWHVDDGLSAAFLAELTEMRLALEPAMATLAATRATPQQIARMHEAADAMARAEGDRAFALADLAFHRRLIEASGNMLMHSAGNVIEAALLTVFHLGSPARLPGVQSAVVAAHRTVVECIADADADAAADGARKIIGMGRNRILDASRDMSDTSKQLRRKPS